MNAREELISNVKDWIAVDNEIREGQKKLKILRKIKKDKTELLVDVMKNNEIDCFDMKEGKLVYKQNKSKAPLSKKHLLQSLSKYFPESNEEVGKIANFIMDTREERIKENIERKNLK